MKIQYFLFALIFYAVPFSASCEIVEYDFNFSTAGSGTFNYDSVTSGIDQLILNFGAYGSYNSGSTTFSASFASAVFGTPPNSFVNNDNTFFNISGGSAYGLRLNSDGTFCVRPDGDSCVNKGGTTEDLAFGTYSIANSTVPIPATAWLFASGMLGLIGVARRNKAA